MPLPPLPEPPRPATRTPFPIVAVAAPVVGAVVIGLVLGSPFMLLFAAMGPIVAVATTLDARRSARRHQRLEVERFERDCALFERAIDRAHDAERRDADEQHPRVGRSPASPDSRDAVRIGTAPARSTIITDSPPPVGDSSAEQRLGRMLARARLNPELPALIARGSVVVRGGGLAADAMVRQLSYQRGVTVHRGHSDNPPPVAATVITVLSATDVELLEPGGAARRVRPEFATERQLEAIVAANEPPERLPTSTPWHALPTGDASSGEGRGVAIGVDDVGPVWIDLVQAGPHALVGGTTGSGKSELLRVLALGWAAAAPPSAAQLLFVDFKGGATFAGLTELPHAVGLVTDLDPIVAQRALRALRAELRHREEVLADAGVRDVRGRPELLPRLLVLVDEFATLCATFPELHGVFADLAARGRSLGVHLVLCTQHPASIVRDTIAANCPVRLSFRVTEAASGGIVGSLAKDLISAPPGRAALVDEQGARLVQVAVVDDDDVARVRAQWQGHAPAASTWCPPLPDRVSMRELPPADDDRSAALPFDHKPHVSGDAQTRDGQVLVIDVVDFGVLDDPDHRRRRRASWSPKRDGSLAIFGASRSGRSTLLATLVHALPRHARAIVVDERLPEAWAVLERLSEHAAAATLLICDGFDTLLARAGDRAPELLSLWDSASRAVRAAGGGVIASFAAASAGGAVVSGRFESRVVLRCADADEHAMAGAPRALFDRRAPAGRGWWHDLQVQVSIGSRMLPPATSAPPLTWQPDRDRDVVVVTSRVAEITDRVAGAGLPHRVVLDLRQIDPASLDPTLSNSDASISVVPRMLVTTPADWQSAWSLLAAARTRVPIVLAHVDHTEARTVLGQRTALAPIDPGRGECWLADSGQPPVRAVWPLLSAGR